jgi:hypothetical protein
LSITLREKRRLRVFENWVLRRTFCSKKDEVGREWRNKDLNDLYSSRNIMQVIKSRRIRLAGHVPHMRERRGMYRVLVGNLRKRDHFEHPG